MQAFFRLIKDRRAATAVEYGLIVALIFLAIAGAVQLLATTTTATWNHVSNEVEAATPKA